MVQFAGNEAGGGGIDEHGVREAKFPVSAGDFGDLSIRMRPRVTRVGDQSADFPPFYGQISRVRGRARRRCWGGKSAGRRVGEECRSGWGPDHSRIGKPNSLILPAISAI